MKDDLIGRVFAYVGGPVAGVTALEAKAAHMPTPEQIPLMAYPVPVVNVTLGDLVALGGLAVVVARFVWDVRRDKRSSANE